MHVTAGRAALLLVAALGCVSCREATAQRGSPQARVVPTERELAVDPRLGFALAPTPLLSRDRRVVSESPKRLASGKHLVDGDAKTSWGAGKPTPDHPAWAAIDVGSGPTAVLVKWSAGGSFDYRETDYGSPGAYRIDTSADSTDGIDGAWKTAVSVAAVTTHAAAHRIDFAGQRWVKLVVLSAPDKSPNGVQIDELEIHDASFGGADSWFFMGDSITAFAFGRPTTKDRSFAALVHATSARYTPVVVGGGMGGEKTDEGLAHLDEWLANNPTARLWGIGYGTNDSAGDAPDPSRFRKNLQAIITRLRAERRVPILATIPYATDGHHTTLPLFNAAIEELRRENALPAGPDLYAWFLAHPEQLRDGLHPNEAGIEAIAKLWADAVAPLYPR